MFGLFKEKKKSVIVEEVVLKDSGRCGYCLGHGMIKVTHDEDIETCPKCRGYGTTNRIIEFREIEED